MPDETPVDVPPAPPAPTVGPEDEIKALTTQLATAQEATRVAQADATDAKTKMQEAKEAEAIATKGVEDMVKEAEAVGEQIAEFEAAMLEANSLIDSTRAEADTAKAETAEAIKTAAGEVERWQNAASEEASKAEAAKTEAQTAKEEAEALKVELEGVKEELAAANAKILAAEETVEPAGPEEEAGAEAPDEPTEPEEPSGGTDAPIEVLPGPPATPAPSYLCRSIFPTTEDTSSNSPAVFSPKRLWSNGQVITYRFVDGHVNQQTKVTKVIPEWSRYANITFKLVSAEALLSISFKNAWECWSHIGTDAHTTTANPPHTMALGAVSISPNTTRGDRALILHQFGHALGLVHEHMCPSKTDAISLKQNLFFKHPSFQGSDSSIGKHPWSVYANSSVTNYASPDLSSIMIFSMPGELNEGNLTIEPNMALSPLDKAFMVINYPRARVHSQASEWTLGYALLIANVDENTSRTITEEHDLAKRRTLFANFVSAARQQASTDFVDPAPEIVDSLRLPAVQVALRAFFADPAEHPGAGEVLADKELKEELIAVLDRLASHRAIREVIQRSKAARAGHPQPEASDSAGAEPAFVNSLLNVALMLHGAAKHRGPTSINETNGVGPKEIDAATTLYTQLAQHTAFRVAMERAVGGETLEKETTPDVSALVARLAERPAVLRAVRQALLGHVR